MGRHAWWAAGLLSIAAAAASPAACSAGGGSDFLDDDDDGSGLYGAGGDGSGAAGGGFKFDAGKGDGALGDGEICEGTSEEADYLPLHIIIVIDRSGSMSPTYWSPLQQALVSFIQDPLSDGLYIGLNYFPAPGHGDSCTVGHWNPVQVPAGAPPMAELPQDAATLVSNINSTSVGNMTPMRPAVEGSYNFARTLQQTYPNEKVIVVLASDGNPNECTNDSISWIATNLTTPAFNNDGIQTFTIAIAAGVIGSMTTIANAGGGQVYDVSQNTSAFAQAMADIRGTALGCEYSIPDQGGQFDPFQVNVVVTIAGGTPTTIPQADNAADCGSDDGWYYDDPIDPTMIILCQKTCDDVQSNQENTSVEINYGCPTEVN